MFISGREGWVRDSVRVVANGVTMAWAGWAKSTGPECRGLGVPLKIEKKQFSVTVKLGHLGIKH